MKTPLAWLNLIHQPGRTLVAIAGVAFACVLLLMQMGFYVAVLGSATRIYDQLEFDLLIHSPRYRILSSASSFPRQRLDLARSVEGVDSIASFYIDLQAWLNQHDQPPRRRGILVMGIVPGEGAFRLDEVRQQEEKLTQIDEVLMDRRSRREFGPRPIGLETEIAGRRIRVAGHYTLGAGFSADGGILTSERTFARIFSYRPTDAVSLGLVRLRPGVDPRQVAERIAAILPSDTVVETRDQVLAQEQWHWVLKTAIGVVLGVGVFIAMVVGIGIVYQVLSSDIAYRLPEYATLKAMGYAPRYLTGNVMMQAGILAGAGFVPGYLIATGLYGLARAQTQLPMYLSPAMAGGVLALSVTMCMISGLLALRKVTEADPADLF